MYISIAAGVSGVDCGTVAFNQPTYLHRSGVREGLGLLPSKLALAFPACLIWREAVQIEVACRRYLSNTHGVDRVIRIQSREKRRRRSGVTRPPYTQQAASTGVMSMEVRQALGERQENG